jgi:hypothetical protein
MYEHAYCSVWLLLHLEAALLQCSTFAGEDHFRDVLQYNMPVCWRPNGTRCLLSHTQHPQPSSFSYHLAGALQVHGSLGSGDACLGCPAQDSKWM